MNLPQRQKTITISEILLFVELKLFFSVTYFSQFMKVKFSSIFSQFTNFLKASFRQIFTNIRKGWIFTLV